MNERFLMDSDSYIRSKREQFAFDIAPGYWEAIVKAHEVRRAESIEQVRKELMRGEDDLSGWVSDHLPKEFFKKVEDQKVQRLFGEISQWVLDHDRYGQPAKQKFVAGADPWLIAYASVNSYTIATCEVAAPESIAFVKLPDVAEQFDVHCVPPFEMLRRIGAKLKLVSGSVRR